MIHIVFTAYSILLLCISENHHDLLPNMFDVIKKKKRSSIYFAVFLNLCLSPSYTLFIFFLIGRKIKIETLKYKVENKVDKVLLC